MTIKTWQERIGCSLDKRPHRQAYVAVAMQAEIDDLRAEIEKLRQAQGVESVAFGSMKPDEVAAELWRLYTQAGEISGSALLAGEKCAAGDKAALYRIACGVLNGIGSLYSEVTGEWPNLQEPRKASPPLQVETQWRSIETAPKIDGAEILMLVNGEPCSGHWYVIPFVEYRDGEGFYVDQQHDDAGWCSYKDGPGVEPTHWMPLPSSPSTPPIQADACKAPHGWPLIALGFGSVEVASGHHESVPALIFGKNGTGVIGEPTKPNREHEPGETLSCVTFANTEALDVVQHHLNKIRAMLSASPAAPTHPMCSKHPRYSTYPFCPDCRTEKEWAAPQQEQAILSNLTRLTEEMGLYPWQKERAELIERLSEKYKPTDVPACRVCGAELDIQSVGGGEPTIYACSKMQLGPGMDWEHYRDSRWEDRRRGGDSDVMELVALLAAAPTQAEPVLTVEVEPDYFSGGHYHEGTKPYIKPTEIWKLPIGTRLYTHPPVQADACKVPREVVDFLRGAAPLDGVWFGERHPTEKGEFWWRKHLDPALAPDELRFRKPT